MTYNVFSGTLNPTHVTSPPQLPPPKKGHSPHFFWPNGWMDQDATWYEGKALAQATLCYMGIQLPTPPHSHLPHFWPMVIVAKWSPTLATAEHLCNITLQIYDVVF